MHSSLKRNLAKDLNVEGSFRIVQVLLIVAVVFSTKVQKRLQVTVRLSHSWLFCQTAVAKLGEWSKDATHYFREQELVMLAKRLAKTRSAGNIVGHSSSTGHSASKSHSRATCRVRHAAVYEGGTPWTSWRQGAKLFGERYVGVLLCSWSIKSSKSMPWSTLKGVYTASHLQTKRQYLLLAGMRQTI